jgi:hypothetical protein
MELVIECLFVVRVKLLFSFVLPTFFSFLAFNGNSSSATSTASSAPASSTFASSSAFSLSSMASSFRSFLLLVYLSFDFFALLLVNLLHY